MEQKTYGVYGLMEWSVLIKMGKRQFRIPFAGGVSSTFGVIPAIYTTNNPIVQLAVESSAYFKTGRIKTVKVVKLEEPKVDEPKKADVSVDVDADEPNENEPKKADVSVDVDADEPNENAVKATCAEDAKDYLVEKLGVSPTKLKTVKAIKELAKQNNILFEGI